mgnify:CR=1 FL=1
MTSRIFVGSFEHQLDDKGRVVLPAPFREHLAGGGYDVFAMQVLSPEEIDPAANGVAGDLRLVDVEDRDVNEVTITPPLLKAYRDRLNAYCGAMREFCIRRAITHVLVDTQTDLDELLLGYLRKRGLLR